mmetsp:Transcript_30900/g.89311  ORF Transcript_30900/g.89311 Transcript_30900/m.89311 type:complete len:229 (+) Transcript_30900:230-916(+)
MPPALVVRVLVPAVLEHILHDEGDALAAAGGGLRPQLDPALVHRLAQLERAGDCPRAVGMVDLHALVDLASHFRRLPGPVPEELWWGLVVPSHGTLVELFLQAGGLRSGSVLRKVLLPEIQQGVTQPLIGDCDLPAVVARASQPVQRLVQVPEQDHQPTQIVGGGQLGHRDLAQRAQLLRCVNRLLRLRIVLQQLAVGELAEEVFQGAEQGALLRAMPITLDVLLGVS